MGSPRKKINTNFTVHEDINVTSTQQPPSFLSSALSLPLTTSRMANQMTMPESAQTKGDATTAIDALMARLSEQRQKLYARPVADDDSHSSTTDPFANTPPAYSSNGSDAAAAPDAAEVLRLKKQLELATERMAQMDLELNQSRLARHTVEQTLGSPFSEGQNLGFNMNGGAQNAFPAPTASKASPHEFAGHGFAPMRLDGGHGQYSAPEYLSQSTDLSPAFAQPMTFGPRPTRHTGYTPPVTPSFATTLNFQRGPMGQQLPPIGTRLSPTASEFSNNVPSFPPQPAPSNYMSTAEPLNYRRLLDRNMTCNWRYIVDKIVCNNDQQASIFLQQKLKVATSEQKFELVQGIIDQAYPLMINRFGNFLVQRCFEHGTPEQVVAIAQAIRGNTLNLSMDAFGCHVVQKAFDSVPEEYKAIMVHELLRRIPETVIHRYACHVWQKLFELRWSGSPPQIMRYVNEALRGMWHEVALGETGSLVVQNIFENCLEEDKRPCINEVLASIDVVAHGQFGNWCIQHICEHGAVPDRSRAIDHVLRFAAEYSMDQFASKVVEKCLKIGGNDFLDRYLDRVCEARSDRPRMPLIDISGDQFGNYLIQYILSNADSQRREIVATHIRKHMVSLRGSKYGSRVAMLCSNPALATRPGPPLPVGRHNSRYSDQLAPEMGRGYADDRGSMGMSRGQFSGYR